MNTLTHAEIIAKAKAEHDRIYAEIEANAQARHEKELEDLADEWEPIIAAIFAALPPELPTPAYQMPLAPPEYRDGGYDYGYHTHYRPLHLNLGNDLSILAYAIGQTVFWLPVLRWSLDEDGNLVPGLLSLTKEELTNQSMTIWLAINDSAQNLVRQPAPTPPTPAPTPVPLDHLQIAKDNLSVYDRNDALYLDTIAHALIAIAEKLP